MNLRDRSAPLRAVACRDDGQTMAEYAFVLGLVMVAAALAFTALGEACVRLLEPVVKAVAP
jgi:Flp pilus assembly pilin Flp